jgi:hypothetical protein
LNRTDPLAAQQFIYTASISAPWYRYLKTSTVVGAEQQWTEGDHYPVIAAFDTGQQVFTPRSQKQRAT